MKKKLIIICSLILSFSVLANEQTLEHEVGQNIATEQIPEFNNQITTIENQIPKFEAQIIEAENQTQEEATQPIMIIRLNKKVVEYQTDLENIIRQVKKANPQTTFHILGFYPNKNLHKQLEEHLDNIKYIIHSNNISLSQIKLVQFPTNDIPYNEIHIILK